MLLITFFREREIFKKLHTIQSGWSIVYTEGPQVIISFKIDFVPVNSANTVFHLHFTLGYNLSRDMSRGQKFHSSARIYEWILERTSESSQSARPSGRVLKSAGEISIF